MITPELALELQDELMKKARDIVVDKRRDYSGKEDPFANFRMSEFVGVPAWKGCMVRLMDKLSRVRHITENKGEMFVKDETIKDTLADALNYICILYGLIMEEEWESKLG